MMMMMRISLKLHLSSPVACHGRNVSFKLAFSTNLPAGLTHRDRFKMFGLVSFSQNIVPVSDMSECYECYECRRLHVRNGLGFRFFFFRRDPALPPPKTMPSPLHSIHQLSFSVPVFEREARVEFFRDIR